MTVTEPDDAVPAASGPTESNPARVYLSSLVPSGRRTMASCAERLARYLSRGAHGIDDFPWATVDDAAAATVRDMLVAAVANEQYARATANNYWYCLRGIVRSAWRMGHISIDVYSRMTEIPPIYDRRPLAGHDVLVDERTRILSAARGDRPADVRDRALIALIYLSGAKRSDVVAFRIDDVALHPPTITFRRRSGNKGRTVPLSADAERWLKPWIDLRGRELGPLFCPINRYGRSDRGHQLSGEAVRKILRRRAEAAGVRPFSPQDLRRTRAGDLLAAGNHLVIVSRVMGHASTADTARYGRPSEQAPATAVRHLWSGAVGRRSCDGAEGTEG